MGGARCLVEAEREASSAETDDQNKEIRGAEHELSTGKQMLSGSLRNVKRISVMACAQWVVVEARPFRGGGLSVVRPMLRHNAIEAWGAIQKSGGWKRCKPQALGRDGREIQIWLCTGELNSPI